MKTDLQILISGDSISGALTLFGNEPIDITYNIADVKELGKSKSTFSKSFTLPGDKNNNKLFSHIFEITNESLDFNPNRKAYVQILADSIPVMNGYMQLSNISLDNQKNPIYNVTCTAEKNTLFTNIGEQYLTDLDFSELNHPYDAATQAATWVTGNTPYYYPLIDYNYNWTANDIMPTGATSSNAVTQLKLFPATQVKYILDKIFSGAGFTYSSAFFNSDRFKNMFIPYNGGKYGAQQSTDWAIQRGFTASFGTSLPQEYITYTSETKVFTSGTTGSSGNTYPMSATTIEYTNASNSNYSLVTDKWTAPDNVYGYFTIGFQLEATYPAGTTHLSGGRLWGGNNPATAGKGETYLYRSSYMSGLTPFETIVLDGDITYNWKGISSGGNGWVNLISKNSGSLQYYNSPTHYPVQSGETFWAKHTIRLWCKATGAPVTGHTTVRLTKLRVENETWDYFKFNAYNTNVLGTTVNYNKMIPQKVKQSDFIKGLINMFNLYIEPSKTITNQLIIEPRDAYYSGGTQYDWSEKLDLTSPIEESFLTDSQARKITFSYKDDKDYLNTFYKESTDRTYGSYIYGVNSDFSADEKKIETIFSPTVAAKIENTPFYIPKIYKFDNNVYGDIATNIRILNKAIVSLGTAQTWTFAGTQYGYYPYIGHTDIPGDNSTFDINFGTVEWETFDVALGDNNLVNEYWLNYLEEISDPSSKIINCQMYLTPSDIAKFKFNDTIYIEGIDNTAGAYYYINKINYNPTVNQTSKVELLKARTPRVRLSTSQVLSTIRKNRFNSLVLGDSAIEGINIFNLGNFNTTSQLATNSILMGTYNTALDDSHASLAIGNFNQIAGFNNIAMGNFHQMVPLSDSVIVDGSGNTSVLKSMTGNTILGGSNVTISGLSYDNTVQGSTNVAVSGLKSLVTNSTDIVVEGDNSIVQGASNVVIPLGVTGATVVGGSNVTASTSNTVYVPNIVVASGGTINGTPITNVVSGSTLWSAGTGIGSVFLNNGTGNIASGIYSHAEGSATTASGLYSHSEGVLTIASGQSSHAEGNVTTAGGLNAHAEGFGSEATGSNSHAEGYNTTALGVSSHSEGHQTTAFGDYGSHSEGQNTIASGESSYAGGINTVAGHYGEWARSSAGNVASQYGILDLWGTTTGNSITEIFLGTSSNRFTIPINRKYKIKLYALVSNSSTNDVKEFEGSGLIKNAGGTTSLVGAFTMTSTNGDVSLAATSITITADDTNDSLKVEVTGIVATNLNWYVKAEYTAIF